jgi:hypothetical protein
MPSWTDGLSADRASALAAKNRSLIFSPPPAHAIADRGAVDKAHRAWISNASAHAEASRQAWAPVGLEMQKRNQAIEALRQKAEQARRKALEAEQAKDEERRQANWASHVLLGAASAEAIAGIRAEIADILGA